MPVIKRYSNRKLYDSQARRYVTLDEVRKMIQTGEPVEIIDHRTGENLTSSTMAQILFEQEKRIGGLLPRVMLAHLIQIGDSALQNFQESVRAFLDPLQHAEDEILRRLDILVHQKQISPEEEQHIHALLMNPALRSTYLSAEGNDLIQTADIQDLQAILKQVDDLEKQLDELMRKKTPELPPG